MPTSSGPFGVGRWLGYVNWMQIQPITDAHRCRHLANCPGRNMLHYRNCHLSEDGGPGKIDHDPAFRHFQQDITKFEKETSDRVFSSRPHRSDVEVHTKVMFVVQDQPERRCASGLLGGGSRLHPVFGLSCDFSNLAFPFEACQECSNRIDK